MSKKKTPGKRVPTTTVDRAFNDLRGLRRGKYLVEVQDDGAIHLLNSYPTQIPNKFQDEIDRNMEKASRLIQVQMGMGKEAQQRTKGPDCCSDTTPSRVDVSFPNEKLKAKAVCETRDKSITEQSVDRLTTALARLHEELSILDSRLLPVKLPKPPTPECKTGAEPLFDKTPCPLAENIMQLALRAEAATHRVMDLLHDVQL